MRVAFLCLMALAGCSTAESQNGAAPDATTDEAYVGDSIADDGGNPWIDDSSGWAPPDAYAIGLIDGGGVFMCNGCMCDGRTHYCDISTGLAPAFDAAGWDACAGSCLELPDGCAPQPTCACIHLWDWVQCSCRASDGGEGLFAGCNIP
jgi:hypothetical protein